MALLDLDAIKAEIDRLASLINASGFLLPTYGASEDFARPHIEVDARGYHYVVVERGIELRRVTTRSLDDLLHQVFDSVTLSLACDFELANRIKGQDSRRLLFQRQLELFSSLRPEWARRHSLEHQRILREHPFDDLSSLRVDLTVALQNNGSTPTEAWRMACETFPLPGKSTSS